MASTLKITSVVSCTTLMMMDVMVDPVTPRAAIQPFSSANAAQMTTSVVVERVLPVTAWYM